MLKKTLEAEDVGLLKHLLELELRSIRKEANVDVVLFMGVDGRIFSSYVPNKLSTREFTLLQLVQENLPHLCAQLRHQNMLVSVSQYSDGTVVISGVGKSAFLVSLIAKDIKIENFQENLQAILKASIVIKHIYELRPLVDKELEEYSPEIRDELKNLSRLLFKEKFTETKEYKKNMELLAWVKKKLDEVLGTGSVEEALTMTFNEMGTQAAAMRSHQWPILLEKIIQNQVKDFNGELFADECMNMWLPDLERKIKSFV